MHERGELAAALAQLGLSAPRPVLVVAGDAGSSALAAADLQPLFDEVLIPCAAARGACIVDGGTDAGVMAMLGQARSRLHSAVPIVGVVVDTLATRPEQRFEHPGGAPLERHHTHFVLVAGSRWGDESPWISAVASELAAGAPSLTVLVGGGDVAWDDVAESVRAARPVIAVAGSGRTADAIAAAARGEARDERGPALAQSGLLTAVDLADRAALAAAIDDALSGRGAMTASPHADALRAELGGFVDELSLTDMQKRFLRARWIDQVAWMEGKAAQAQQRYYRLRLTTVIGAVMVPAFVSLHTLDGALGDIAQTLSVLVSLVVAVSAAIEQFFDFGGRWQHYRRSVEQLKTEGWSFLQLTGRYAELTTHVAAYPAFTDRVEQIIQSDVESFVTELAGKQERELGGSA